MKQESLSTGTNILTIGLAIFAMLFGAGNIIYPIKAGVMSGNLNWAGMLGFIITGVFLPIIGLVAMVLFEGDYQKFFARIGRIPGAIAIGFCLFIIGPMLAMPRGITVPYDIIKTFLPIWLTLPVFSISFVCITFFLTYKETSILSNLGKFISPIKIGSLAIIIAKGLWQAESMAAVSTPVFTIFTEQLGHGFQTLDLLGSLFFAYIVIRILKQTSENNVPTSALAKKTLQGGLVASAILIAAYLGLSFLAAYHSNLVAADQNGAEMFKIIGLHVVHHFGMFIMIVAVVMSCLSTVTALAAVFAEYLRSQLFGNRICYTTALVITLAATAFFSNFGLSNILKYGEHPIMIGYPIIIAITICNIAYKLFDFKPIKAPVAIIGTITTGLYIHSHLAEIMALFA